MFFAAFLMIAGSAKAQTASGGNYAVEQGGVTSGGGTSEGGGSYSLSGAAGQPVTGTSSGGSYAARSGVMASEPLAPTSAQVALSGRVFSAYGRGILRVRVTITSATGESRTIFTDKSGYYRFEAVEAGQTYVISVKGMRFRFAQPSQVVFAGENLNDINFSALP